MKHLVYLILIAMTTGVVHAAPCEGVKTTIDTSRLNEVQAWLNNAKVELSDALSNALESPIEQQEFLLRSAIDSTLATSVGKNEYLTRNILYRTQKLHDILRGLPNEPKRNAVARRILRESIKIALSQYQLDLQIMKNPANFDKEVFLKPVEFAVLGLDWADYVLSLHYLIPTSESRLASLQLALGLLYNDILDDSQFNRLLAPVAKHIAVFNDQMQSRSVSTPVERLAVTREIRQFLSKEIATGRGLLGDEKKMLKIFGDRADLPIARDSTPKPTPAARFQSNAFDVCKLLSYDTNKPKCIAVATAVTNETFSVPAVNFCIEFREDLNRISCLEAIRYHEYSPIALETCAAASYEKNKLTCLRALLAVSGSDQSPKTYRPGYLEACQSIHDDDSLIKCVRGGS